MKKFKIFCDFDGTITQEDLGDAIFREFGRIEPYNRDLKAGKINIYDYWHTLCSKLDVDVKAKDIIEYAKKSEIDAYFVKFYEMCKEMGIPFYILSDGFDIYIRTVLENNGLGEIEFYSNKLKEVGSGFEPEFTFASDSCNCFSASCKRNLAVNRILEDEISIYIGDGYSDFCGAEHCDIIFAKKDLAKYCNERRLPHYPWRSFFDVMRIFKEQILNGKAKQRHDAKIKRKRAFEAE